MAFAWYVAQTYPNAEAAAERRLNRQLFATHLPRRTIRTPLRGKIVARAAPCFPGYLFLLLDLAGEDWKDIATGTRQARHMPGADRVGMYGEHNGDRPGRLPGGLNFSGRIREDEVDILTNQLGREFGPMSPAKSSR
jgi:hypothetical protein